MCKQYDPCLFSTPEACEARSESKTARLNTHRTESIVPDERYQHMCSLNHKFFSRYKDKGYCTYCNNRKLLKGFNDLRTISPALADQFDTGANPTKSNEVLYGSGEKSSWIGECGHTWNNMSPAQRLKGQNCPYCSNRRAKADRSLAHQYPQLISTWDEHRNSTLMNETFKTNEKYWWTCELNHSFERTVYKQRDNGCPVCSGHVNDPVNYNFQKICEDLNRKDLLAQWDYEKNTKNPNEYSPQSNQSAHWLCEQGHSWKAVIASRWERNCSRCFSKSSKSEDELFAYINDLISCEQSVRSIIPPYEIDIFVPELNLGFEFNGTYWHSNKTIKQTKGMTAHEYHQRKLELANNKGVELYFLWEDDWTLQKEKLKEIIAKILRNEPVDDSLLKVLSKG